MGNSTINHHLQVRKLLVYQRVLQHSNWKPYPNFIGFPYHFGHHMAGRVTNYHRDFLRWGVGALSGPEKCWVFDGWLMVWNMAFRDLMGFDRDLYIYNHYKWYIIWVLTTIEGWLMMGLIMGLIMGLLVDGLEHGWIMTFHFIWLRCHPNPIDELHHFSRWLLHHQPDGF